MKFFKHLLQLLILLFIFTGMISCDLLGGVGSPLMTGTWDTGYGMITVDSDSFSSYGSNGSLSYSGTITTYSNTEWNGSETGEGIYGYLIIQYDNNPSWNTTFSIEDKFMVVRWQNILTENGVTTVEYSEGYNGPTGYFDTEAEAFSGATEADGYFSFFSSVTR